MGEKLEELRIQVRLVVPVVSSEGLPGEAPAALAALEPGDPVGPALGPVVAVANVESGAAASLGCVGATVGMGASWRVEHRDLLFGIVAAASCRMSCTLPVVSRAEW